MGRFELSLGRAGLLDRRGPQDQLDLPDLLDPQGRRALRGPQGLPDLPGLLGLQEPLDLPAQKGLLELPDLLDPLGLRAPLGQQEQQVLRDLLGHRGHRDHKGLPAAVAEAGVRRLCLARTAPPTF